MSFYADCRDQYAHESEDPGRRKSLQIMPVDSSPSAAPSHSASAERLQESEELKSNGMRITFKVLHASHGRSDCRCLDALNLGTLMPLSCMYYVGMRLHVVLLTGAAIVCCKQSPLAAIALCIPRIDCKWLL